MYRETDRENVVQLSCPNDHKTTAQGNSHLSRDARMNGTMRKSWKSFYDALIIHINRKLAHRRFNLSSDILRKTDGEKSTVVKHNFAFWALHMTYTEIERTILWNARKRERERENKLKFTRNMDKVQPSKEKKKETILPTCAMNIPWDEHTRPRTPVGNKCTVERGRKLVGCSELGSTETDLCIKLVIPTPEISLELLIDSTYANSWK